MANDPSQRAADVDRDVVINHLSEAYAQGRLTRDELETRLGQAQTARTYGELATLTADLPQTGPLTTDGQGFEQRKAWIGWAGVSGLVNVIWLATWVAGGDGPTYYWPIWVMGPWGVVLLVRTLSSRRP